MGRRIGYLIAAAIIVGAIALAVFLVSLAPEAERREPPSRIPYVETAAIVPGSGAIPVYGAGTVRPSAEIDIAPQVGGRVVWVDPGFRSGERVVAGQMLFRIEEADYRTRVREAEAALADRKVALLQAEEDAAIARAEYERYSSQQDAAGAASPLTLREPQLKAARAALKREEAKLARANLALSRTRIEAPFDGFVREESVALGQLAVPGKPVGRLFAADAAEVVVPLSDADAALIPGLWTIEDGEVSARVVADYGGIRYAWPGYVDRAEVSLDERTRTIDVIVRVPDPFAAGQPVESSGGVLGEPPLLVGKFAEVEINGLAPDSYFRVRRAALQPGNEVWAVGQDGTVRIVPVQVLQRGNDEVFVTGAFTRRQSAIISGLQFATDGMAVRAGGSAGQGAL
ncbi:MAG: efflux RND transporter periplasmic adaptor subunit [Gammaproteobacteria bacterium]|nr:efflux RND transporter periplasmic adaptor subunit [Gammaproteobacteria bacterium]MYE86858.1 efflux RND transporter periplasmic adaptor subunit [Gammaproteobacteria bacterium]MYF09462.1 efflux RND transporter periplasmic adaptor subunit [Gammaproteobacteria bacterium]